MGNGLDRQVPTSRLQHPSLGFTRPCILWTPNKGAATCTVLAGQLTQQQDRRYIYGFCSTQVCSTVQAIFKGYVISFIGTISANTST